MSLPLVILLLLIVVLVGGIGPVVYRRSPWPYAYGLGHSGISAMGVVLVVLLLMLLLGRL